MPPYSSGLLLDNTNNYSIVKTETVFGFGPTNNNNYVNENLTKPLEWIMSHGKFSPRALQDINPRLIKKDNSKSILDTKKTKTMKKSVKNEEKRIGKGKKCVFKVIKSNEKKNKRGANKAPKLKSKYMMPMMLGLLAAKSLLIPIALKALAFVSAKGLMMGFFSTVMASVLSLKGMFEHNHHYQNRKDDTKTQVEIIQVPSKSEDHVYYDESYKKSDLIPVNLN